MKRKSVLVLLALLSGLGVTSPAAGNWLADAAKSPVKQFDGITPLRRGDQGVDRRDKVVIRRIKPQCYSDWNNDPTALPSLTYQIQERTRNGGEFPIYTDNTGLELLGDEMFDYPIIYFTSHYPFAFTDEEVENLKKYLARGGTLLLDDCTGSGPFTDSVYPNVQRIVPGGEMHLMLRSSKEFFDLWNMVYEMHHLPQICAPTPQPFQAAYVNGRPAILHCPNDYGCGWEITVPPSAINPLGGGDGDREAIFRYSINWVLYALTH
jgi:hypothetical protein